MTEVKREIAKVLAEQAEKRIKRWQIAISLYSKGFSEGQVAQIMGFSKQTAHACKIDFCNNKARREIKNYLRLDVIKMQSFIKSCKALVGEPQSRMKGEK